MALTESNMLPLGTLAPDFQLPDTRGGGLVHLHAFTDGQPFCIMFLCNHCPYVIHVNPEIVRLSEAYQAKGIRFVGISSNDAEKYPDDGPEKMTLHAQKVGYNFPYLYDEHQTVARAYDAACTPDFYVFDRNKKLVYRGRLDGSRPANDLPLDGADLREALDAVLNNEPLPEVQYPSAGCNIKWKPSAG